MNQKQYVREIVERSCLPKRECKRLENDLDDEINTALEKGESIEQIINRMGDPDEVAAELYKNFSDMSFRPFREYKSKKTLFGLPLVHIIRSYERKDITVSSKIPGAGERNRIYRLPTARGIFALGRKAEGIFAVGNISAGFISIGNISAGIISIGNIATGLFSIGNIALALFFTLGNFATGLLAGGNMSLGYAAAGNFAIGEYAIGNKVEGTFTYIITNLSAQIEQIKLFFAELEAPAPVKAFFGIVENVLEMLNDPVTALPLIITLCVVLTLAITLLCIIPKRLLDRNK